VKFEVQNVLIKDMPKSLFLVTALYQYIWRNAITTTVTVTINVIIVHLIKDVFKIFIEVV